MPCPALPSPSPSPVPPCRRAAHPHWSPAAEVSFALHFLRRRPAELPTSEGRKCRRSSSFRRPPPHRWLHANPRWCKPGPPGLAWKVGQASACHPPASACHALSCALNPLAGRQPRQASVARRSASPRSMKSSISRSSWSGCTLDGCVAPQAQDRQRHGEIAAPHALRGRSFGPDLY